MPCVHVGLTKLLRYVLEALHAVRLTLLVPVRLQSSLAKNTSQVGIVRSNAIWELAIRRLK